MITQHTRWTPITLNGHPIYLMETQYTRGKPNTLDGNKHFRLKSLSQNQNNGFVHTIMKKYSYLIASTTTILNSSEISDINDEICFISLSTLLSFPV